MWETSELGSWKQVLDRHGQNVAYAALRQGTLPYVPHSLLLPGHGVKWPESHEFILSRQFWNEHWRSEITFETDEENAATQNEIHKWLADNRVEFSDHQEWSVVRGSALTGIPQGSELPTPEPAATAFIKTEAERAVHPEFYGPKYDELHAAVAKNVSKVTQEWPKMKTKHDISIAKAKDHPLCGQLISQLQALLKFIDERYKKVEAANTTMQVKGRGFLSQSELETAKDNCEKNWLQHKDVETVIKALEGLVRIPAGTMPR